MTRVPASQKSSFDKGAPHNCRSRLAGDDTFTGTYEGVLGLKHAHTHTHTKKGEQHFDSLLYTKQAEAGVPCRPYAGAAQRILCHEQQGEGFPCSPYAGAVTYCGNDWVLSRATKTFS